MRFFIAAAYHPSARERIMLGHLIRRLSRDILWLARWYWTTTRRMFRRIECRRSGGHLLILCHIEVKHGTGKQRHVHECGWCQTRVLDQVAPVDSDIKLLLRDLGIQLDPGLTLPQQREYMH